MSESLSRRDVRRLEGKTGGAVWFVLGCTAMLVGAIPIFQWSDAVAHAVVTDTTASYPLLALGQGMVLFMIGVALTTLGNYFWRFA